MAARCWLHVTLARLTCVKVVDATRCAEGDSTPQLFGVSIYASHGTRGARRPAIQWCRICSNQCKMGINREGGMITAESHNALLPYSPAGAVFSDDMVYRYRLWRTWDPELPAVCFIMCNPSTADHEQDDPTIRRCLDFAKQWGYGRLLVGNLFALRATDPQKLRQHPEPTGGPDNDDTIMAMHEEANFTVAAWGVHGAHLRRTKPTESHAEQHAVAVGLPPGVDQERTPATPAVSPQGRAAGTLEDLMQVVNIEMRVEGMVARSLILNLTTERTKTLMQELVPPPNDPEEVLAALLSYSGERWQALIWEGPLNDHPPTPAR